MAKTLAITAALLSAPTLASVGLSDQWWVLGPFVSGTRDHLTDPVFDLALSGLSKEHDWSNLVHAGVFGLFSRYADVFEPLNKLQQYPSELCDGGFTNWTLVEGTVSAQDNVFTASANLNFPQVDWSFVEAPLGNPGAMFQSWAVTEFEYDQNVILVHCNGVSTVFVDSFGTPIQGDAYSDGYAWFPVALDAKSKHLLYVAATGYESTGFSCDFKAPESDIFAHDTNYVVMDIVDSALPTELISVSLVNARADLWFSDIQVTTDTAGFEASIYVDEIVGEPELAPLQASPVSVALKMNPDIDLTNLTSIELDLTFTGSLQSRKPHEPLNTVSFASLKTSVKLSIRTGDEPFKYTYADFDGTVQYTAVWAPKIQCDGGCPVLLTTHGAGVDSDEIGNPAWAYSYQQQDSAWILLPLGRRRYGYDWQNAGRVDALRALESLKQVFGADTSRVLFAGHSMGGHGCWSLSGLNPDLALAAAPAAGWIRFQLYSPYFTRPAYDYIDPTVIGLLESALAEGDAGLHSSNLKGIDLMVRMGSKDDNVPPYEMRRMARLQLMQGGKAQISEIPGEGHWFGGVVDDAIMQGFFDEHFASGVPLLPDRFTFTCVNPSACGTRAGFKILQTDITFRASKIHFYIQGSLWKLTTSNVIRLSFVRVNQHAKQFPEQVVIDHTVFDGNQLIGKELCRETVFDSWTVCNQAAVSQRIDTTYGPLRAVLLNRLVVVYGTQADSKEENDLMYNQALLFAERWYYQGRGQLKLVPDYHYADLLHQALNSDSGSFSGILIGSPKQNLVTRHYQSSWKVPVTFARDGSFAVGPRRFSDAGVGVMFEAPHPDFPGAFLAVLAGTDVNGVLVMSAFFPQKSGETVPDWIVLGADASYRGLGSTIGAGFWSRKWDLQPEMTYLI